ncbi:hypothetical protein BDN72DRAFT_755351, partial [Pluteus cervinus]
QDSTWKAKEQSEEARHAQAREKEQLEAIRQQLNQQDCDFEGGYGGQEDLEDRYATTSGEH